MHAVVCNCQKVTLLIFLCNNISSRQVLLITNILKSLISCEIELANEIRARLHQQQQLGEFLMYIVTLLLLARVVIGNSLEEMTSDGRKTRVTEITQISLPVSG